MGLTLARSALLPTSGGEELSDVPALVTLHDRSESAELPG